MITPGQSLDAKPIPFIHESSENGSTHAFMYDRVNFLRGLAATGDICGFHVGPMTMAFCNKAEYAHSVLVEAPYKYFSKSRPSRNFITRVGVFGTEGEEHRKRRKLLAPMFQPRQFVHYADSIVEYSEQFAQSLSEGMTFNLNQQMVDLTRRIIVKTLFGLEMDERSQALVAAIVAELRDSTKHLGNSNVVPESEAAEYERRMQESKNFLESTLNQLVEERRGQQSQQHMDMLSVLANMRDEDGNYLDNQQIIDECILIFPAGSETTMSAFAWVWYYLCQQPDLYEKVQQEVRTALQGRRATFDDLANLPYCLQVFREAIRVYPPIPFQTREALEDITMDGYFIPKGTTLLISTWTLHHRPEYFPEPDKFDPDRFTPENEKRIPRYAYLPFGVGPRICIGMHFALMEAQLVIATIAQHVTFSFVPGQDIEVNLTRNLTLRPNGNLEMAAHRN